MPAIMDSIEQTLRQAYSHMMNAGAFNEGQPNQVRGEDLPPEIQILVEKLAKNRDAMQSAGSLSKSPETLKTAEALQEAINYLYNPRTRDAAVNSWKQLHGDETNPWSATGGDIGHAAAMVNQMTADPQHYQYGGPRAGAPLPPGARVAPGK